MFVVNEDPLQESLPLWYVAADRFIRADSRLVLQQLGERCPAEPDPAAIGRIAQAAEDAASLRRTWSAQADADARGRRLTPASVAAALHRLLDEDAIVINEAISEAPTVWKHLPRSRPGSQYGNRGTSLGWSGGGALGIKLAAPDRTVVSIVGDGTFFFSAPSSTYWIARRYGLPVLTVVLDNGGWNATKRNVENYVKHNMGLAHESLGGPANLTLSMLIENLVNERLAWPLAAAGSMVLLAASLLILAIAGRFVPVRTLAEAR